MKQPAKYCCLEAQNVCKHISCRWLGCSDVQQLLPFDRQSSGLAGLSFDEGEFGVFGYVTKARCNDAQI